MYGQPLDQVRYLPVGWVNEVLAGVTLKSADLSKVLLPEVKETSSGVNMGRDDWCV